MSSRRTLCVLPSASSSSIGRLGLGGEQAVEDPAVGGGDGVLDEVPLDAPARVEDVDQQLVLGVGGHAGQVGADLAPLAAVACGTWRTAAVKTSLPLRGVAALRGRPGASASMTFWRSASGRPPPWASSVLARAAIACSGWAARACFWSSESSSSRTLALLDAVEERRGPVVAAEQGAGSPRTGRRA